MKLDLIIYLLLFVIGMSLTFLIKGASWLFILVYFLPFIILIINRFYCRKTKVPYRDVFPTMPELPTQNEKNEDTDSSNSKDLKIKT